VLGQKIRFSFKYYPELIKEVKETFGNRKYVPEKKQWEIPINSRNLFRLDLMMKDGGNPYQRYDDIEKPELYKGVYEKVVKALKAKTKTPYEHQYEMITNAIISRWFIWAAEMGLGKTLSAIVVMEMSGIKDCIWVGPNGPLVAAKADFRKWKAKVEPLFLTYDGLRSLIAAWPAGKPAPQLVIFDEASRLKNPVAKRSIAAQHLADSMRREHKNCIVGALSGTPAPKSPVDWWSVCEIVCPGYIREGHPKVFQDRLAIMEQRETVHGAGSYGHVVAWKDDSNRCDKCGQPKEHANHEQDATKRLLATLGGTKQSTQIHDFVPSKNEVAELAKRLRGLVTVKLKRDCTDLPELRFRTIQVKPAQSVLNAAKLIVRQSARAIQALTLLRELSDGFQYATKETGQHVTCEGCGGKGTIIEYINEADPHISLTDLEIKEGVRFIWSECPADDDPDIFVPEIIDRIPIKIQEELITCPECNGERVTPVMERTVVEFPCPKDDVLINLLDEHEDVGRFVVYGGFTGTIDKIVRICLQQDWSVVRVDGKGWKGYQGSRQLVANSSELLDIFSNRKDLFERCVFVGQPGAAGMGLTLTASPSTFFYSNDFNGESRQQACHRGHRLGMDVERGGNIIDVIHLDSDRLVIENLKRKSDLQYMSMKGLKNAFE
jgi:SNF2 family DNA or RNA helicase